MSGCEGRFFTFCFFFRSHVECRWLRPEQRKKCNNKNSARNDTQMKQRQPVNNKKMFSMENRVHEAKIDDAKKD